MHSCDQCSVEKSFQGHQMHITMKNYCKEKLPGTAQNIASIYFVKL